MLPAPVFLPEGGSALHVLFIGNSLTFTNNIPERLAMLAKGAPEQRHVDAISRSYPNVTLEWHLTHPETLQAIHSQHWDAVVLQDQSYRSIKEQPEALVSLAKMKELIGKQTNSIYLYTIASADWKPEYQSSVDAFNACAAQRFGFRLAPVGGVFELVHKHFPDFPVYEPDDHHPGPGGAMLAAEIFYRMLTGSKRAIQLPPKLRRPAEIMLDLLMPRYDRAFDDHVLRGVNKYLAGMPPLETLMKCPPQYHFAAE